MIVFNCGKKVNVKSIEEASKVIRKTIEEKFMGSTKWYGYENNGLVIDGNDHRAKISYNGRIWPV